MHKTPHTIPAVPTEDQVDGRRLRYRHRRGELVDAVMDYVLEHGIADLSFRPLAQAVGVSHVTLRHHFGTKEELVAEILETLRARAPIPAGAADDETLLRGLWAQWSTPEGQRHFRLLFEVYGEALMHPRRYRRFLDAVVDDWLRVITGIALDAGCPEADAERFATVLLAQFRGLLLDLLATGDRARVDAAADAVLTAAAVERATWRRV